MQVGTLRILVDELRRHGEVAGHLLGVLLAQGLQLVARGRVQITGRDLIRKLRVTGAVARPNVPTGTVVLGPERAITVAARTLIPRAVGAIAIATRAIVVAAERTVAIATRAVALTTRAIVVAAERAVAIATRTVPLTTGTVIVAAEGAVALTTGTVIVPPERTVTLTARTAVTTAERAVITAAERTVALTSRARVTISARTVIAWCRTAERTPGTVAIDIATRTPRAVILAVARGLAVIGHVVTPFVRAC
jgi:hypothetical protein